MNILNIYDTKLSEFVDLYHKVDFYRQKKGFLRKQRWKIFIFHADIKKTKNAQAISKIIRRLWKSRTKKIKCWKKIISKVFEKKIWPKISKFKFCVSQIIAIFGCLGILKVPFSLGSRHERLREAAWRGRKNKKINFF